MKILHMDTAVGAPPDAHDCDTSELMEQVQAVEMRAIKGGDYDLASLMGDVYWRLDGLQDEAEVWEQRAKDAGWGNPGGAYAEIERLRGLIARWRRCTAGTETRAITTTPVRCRMRRGCSNNATTRRRCGSSAPSTQAGASRAGRMRISKD